MCLRTRVFRRDSRRLNRGTLVLDTYERDNIVITRRVLYHLSDNNKPTLMRQHVGLARVF